jgi:hypothetical protein
MVPTYWHCCDYNPMIEKNGVGSIEVLLKHLKAAGLIN